MLNQGTILLNRYRIERLHELGAVETIYLGSDIQSDKAVTISETKSQPNLQYDDLQTLIQQFMQAGQTLCKLDHPHLVPPIDCFFIDTPSILNGQNSEIEENLPHSYVVTPALDYDSLIQRINNQGSIQENNGILWADQVLQALAYCHNLNVLHGDIRPHNIFLTPDGNAILTHFEVPSLWQPSDPRKWTAKRVLGTPDYAPPERWALRVGQIDERSDIYSLGATFYHALTGQVPLSAGKRTANPYSFQDIQITNAKVSNPIKDVITKSMAVPKDKRYSSAASMASALRVSTARQLQEKKPALPSLFPPRNHKRFLIFKFAGLILSSFVLFFAATIGLWLNTIIPSAQSWFSPPTLMVSATNAAISPTPPTSQIEMVPATPTPLPATTVPTATPAIVTKPPPIFQTIIISDTFDSNTYDWPLSDHQDDWGSIVREVNAGVYMWNVDADLDVGRWCLPDSDSYGSDFSLSVDVRRLNGPPNIAYGLIIRHSEGSYYVFNARDDGYFRFSLWEGSEWVTIIDWTETLSIRSGETNHLEVIARDTEFEFYINDVYVGDAADEAISAGDNGLSAIVLANPEIALLEFDNFMLLSDNPR